MPEEAKVKSIQGILNKNSPAATAKNNDFGRAKKMLEMNVNLTGMPRKESGMLDVGQDINQQIPMESFRYDSNVSVFCQLSPSFNLLDLLNIYLQCS